MLDRFRILIVDDDRMVLDLMMFAARRHPILKVEKTNDPGQAIEMIKKNSPYHIILTDLSMPGFTGLDVLRAARVKSPDTRGIIVTGFGDTDSTREAIKLGVSDYLHKPFRMEVMDLTLRNAIDHFQLRTNMNNILNERDGLKEVIEEKSQKIEEMEHEANELEQELTEYVALEEREKKLSKALAKPEVQKANQIGTVSRELTDVGTLVEQKKITEEEFRNMKKSILDRAYKSIVS